MSSCAARWHDGAMEDQRWKTKLSLVLASCQWQPATGQNSGLQWSAPGPGALHPGLPAQWPTEWVQRASHGVRDPTARRQGPCSLQVVDVTEVAKDLSLNFRSVTTTRHHDNTTSRHHDNTTRQHDITTTRHHDNTTSRQHDNTTSRQHDTTTRQHDNTTRQHDNTTTRHDITTTRRWHDGTMAPWPRGRPKRAVWRRGAWGGSPPSLAPARDRSEIAYHVARRRRRFCHLWSCEPRAPRVKLKLK